MAEFDASQQDWLKPQDSYASYATASSTGDPPPPPAAHYQLRPLSSGEVLDRTILLYRSRFWLFAGLSSLGASVNVLSGIARIAFLNPLQPALGLRNLLPGYILTLVGALLAFAAYSVTHAATTSAVSALYLGEPTSIAAALRSVGRRWFRYPLIALWQSWSVMWVFLLLIVPVFAIPALGLVGFGWLIAILIFLAVASLIYGLIAYIRNSLAVPASVIEHLPVRASMRRSKDLAQGTLGRIFLLLLLLCALYIVVGAVQMPLVFLTLRMRSSQLVITQAIALFINFLAGSLLGPVGAIALCLFYFDQRVRKEAFDLEFLMDRTAPPTPVAIIPTPPTSETAPTEPA